jgi:hypothetical protein
MRQRLWFAGLLVAVCAVNAAAQREETHRGMHLAFTLGRGSMKLECGACETSGQGDISALGRLGWNARENLVLGFEVVGFSKAQIVDNETASASFVSGSAVVLYYPNTYGEGFLKLGAGYSNSEGRFFVSGFGNSDISLGALTFVAGLGYDIRLGRTFSITPHIDYHIAVPGDMKIDGQVSSVQLRSNVLNIGIGLTRH